MILMRQDHFLFGKRGNFALLENIWDGSQMPPCLLKTKELQCIFGKILRVFIEVLNPAVVIPSF